jgi:hypothetical protein
MYKNTERLTSFHQRVASSSTKPYAGGRVEVLPPEAKPWEEIYLSLFEQYEIIVQIINDINDRISEVNLKALDHLPWRDIERIAIDRNLLIVSRNQHTQLLGSVRRAIHNVRNNAFGACFLEVARHRLTNEQFQAILDDVKPIIEGSKVSQKLPTSVTNQSLMPKSHKERLNAMAYIAQNPTSERADILRKRYGWQKR